MPTYDLTVRCKVCGHDHSILMRLHVEEGADRRQSIAELYHGRSVPPQVAAIRGHLAFCHKTGRKFPLENDNEIFLVPPTFFRRYSAVQ